MTRFVLHVLALALGPALPLACSDSPEDGGGQRSCGDSKCSIDTCETSVRCADDCGACSGAACTVGGTVGSCTESCESSCDCVNDSEVCTKDYGVAAGTCIPAACLTCGKLSDCTYSPNASGHCETSTCG